MDELTERLESLQKLQGKLEEANKKLQEELEGLNTDSVSGDKLGRSYSSSDKKLDLFNSEVDINLNDSIENDSQLSKKEYCAHCLKMFDLNVQYDMASLEKTLETEILDFEGQINGQTLRKTEVFQSLYPHLKDTIQTALDAPFELYPYGSFASGLNMPWSDIDIVLDTFTETGVESLELLEAAFAKLPIVAEVKFIKNTSIPVLKLVANAQYDNLKIDMTLQDIRHSGVSCVGLVQQFMVMYPLLKPLALVLKQLLFLGKLNDPFQKGLSSYGLVLMIVAFFQWCIVSNTYDTVCANPGRALIHLLRHYGSVFDYVNWKIAPTAGGEIANPYIPVD